MSYSGFYQYLCARGHYDCEDAFTCRDLKDWRCPTCGGELAWWNSVNTTNGSFCREWDKENDVCREESYDCDYEYSTCSEEQLERCKRNCGRIDGYVELEAEQEEEQKLCLWCGCSKVVKEKTYKIPEDVGHKVGEE